MKASAMINELTALEKTLARCPFCKGKAKVRTVAIKASRVGPHFEAVVFCSVCGATGPSDLRLDGNVARSAAASRWNDMDLRRLGAKDLSELDREQQEDETELEAEVDFIRWVVRDELAAAKARAAPKPARAKKRLP